MVDRVAGNLNCRFQPQQRQFLPIPVPLALTMFLSPHPGDCCSFQPDIVYKMPQQNINKAPAVKMISAHQLKSPHHFQRYANLKRANKMPGKGVGRCSASDTNCSSKYVIKKLYAPRNILWK